MKKANAYTLDEIKEQISAIDDPYIFWTNKEIRTLPQLLDHGEVIVALTSGFLNSRTWLAVCTTRRLLFINCNMFFGFEQVQMPLDRVQSIDQQFTVFFGSISVFDGVNVFYLKMIRKSAIMPFVKSTQEAMYEFKRGPAPVAVSVAAPAHHESADVASQLSKLVELKEKGYLTDEEFQTQKKKLLAS